MATEERSGLHVRDGGQRLSDLEQEVEALKRQLQSARRQIQQNEEWLDTIASPWWMKCWWFVLGWRWYRVGRWYGN